METTYNRLISNIVKGVVALLMVVVPLMGISQKPITRPGTKKPKTTQTSKPAKHHRPQAQKKPAAPPIKLSLATELDGRRCYYTESEWKAMPLEQRQRHNKLGLVIESKGERFMFGLHTNDPHKYDSSVSFDEARKRTGDQLPTKNQAKIFLENYEKIWRTLLSFGDVYFSSHMYWCNDGTVFHPDYNKFSNSEVGSFRWCTSDVETGYVSPIVRISDTSQLDYIYPNKEKYDLRVVRARGKYGFIDSKGNVVVPIKYDAVEGFDKAQWADMYDYYGVCLDGKWGMVDRTGKEVIPLEYEAITGKGRKGNLICVKKENLLGYINDSNEIVVPIKFRKLSSFHNGHPAVALDEETQNYGFINADGSIAAPFVFDVFYDFQPISEDIFDGPRLAEVSDFKSKKRGYVDEDGKLVIPIKFESGSSFKYGAASVELNGKMGIIDKNGNFIVPNIYDSANVAGNFSKSVDNYSKSKIDDAGNCIFRKNGKYGIINIKGEVVVDFKYSDLRRCFISDYYEGNSYVLPCYEGKIGNNYVYLDSEGHQFASEKEFKYMSEETAASKGDRYALYKLGDSLFIKKEYEKAFPLIKKSADKGYAKAIALLGKYYFYGYAPVSKSFPDAYRLFERAAKMGDSEGIYFYAWMLEHNYTQYGIKQDFSEAFKWYGRTDTRRDQAKRIEELSKRLKQK